MNSAFITIADLLSHFVKCSPRFSPGYEGTEKMFYFVNELKQPTSKNKIYWSWLLFCIYVYVYITYKFYILTFQLMDRLLN